MAVIGEGICAVKTLTRNHLYCEPPSQQPLAMALKRREGADVLPEFTVSHNLLACCKLIMLYHTHCCCISSKTLTTGGTDGCSDIFGSQFQM